MERTTSPNLVPRRIRSYAIGKELGHGSFGKVYEATKDGTEEKVAIKAIDLRHMQLQEMARRNKLLKTLSREINILRKLPRHENIVELIESIEEDPNWCFLVLELVALGDLFTALTARPTRTFQELEVAFVFRQLVKGLSFLHEHDVIHRDLKLENILVAGETKEESLTFFSIKITDFGLSKEVGEGLSVAQSVVGSPRYTAPEVYSRSPYEKEVDFWSLGALLYTLLAGRLLDRKDKVPKQADVTEILAKLSAGREAHSLLTGLLQVDPTQRWSLNELTGHSWFTRNLNGEPALLPSSSVKTPSHSPGEESLFGSQLTPTHKASLAQPPESTGSVPASAPVVRHDASGDRSTEVRSGEAKPKPRIGRMRLRSRSGIGKTGPSVQVHRPVGSPPNAGSPSNADGFLQVIMVDSHRVVCILCNGKYEDLIRSAKNLLNDAFPDVKALVIKGSDDSTIGTERLSNVWPEFWARSGCWISGAGSEKLGAAGFGSNKEKHLKALHLAASIAAAAAGLSANAPIPDQVQQFVHQVKNFRSGASGARGSVGNLGLQAPGTPRAHLPRAADSATAAAQRQSTAARSRRTPRAVAQVRLQGSDSGSTTTASQTGEPSERNKLYRTYSRWVAPGGDSQRRSGTVRGHSGVGRSRCSKRRSDRRSRSRSPRGTPGSVGGDQHVGARARDGSDRSGRSGRRPISSWGSNRNQSSCGTPASGTPTAGASSSAMRNGRASRVTLTSRQEVEHHREQRGVRLEPARGR